MRSWQRRAAALLVPLVLALTACAATARSERSVHYVAPNGSDLAAGSQERPWKTVQHAVDRARPGDTILLQSGVYVGSIRVVETGAPDAWITLKAAPGAKPVIAAPLNNDPAIWFNPGRCAPPAPCQPMYWRVEGLEIRGGYYVVKMESGKVELLRNNLHGSSHDIVKLVASAHDVVIKGNEIHHPQAAQNANAQGIDIVGADRTYVGYNYVHDIPSLGMYAKGTAHGTVFEFNRVENTYDRAIMLGQRTGGEFMKPNDNFESTGGVIRNNVIRNSRHACLAVASSRRAKIHNNTCINAATEVHGAIFISNESEREQPNEDIEIRDNVIVMASNRPAVKLGPKALADYSRLRMEGNVYWHERGQPIMFMSEDHQLYGANLDKWRGKIGVDRKSSIGMANGADAKLRAGAPAKMLAPDALCKELPITAEAGICGPRHARNGT